MQQAVQDLYGLASLELSCVCIVIAMALYFLCSYLAYVIHRSLLINVRRSIEVEVNVSIQRDKYKQRSTRSTTASPMFHRVSRGSLYCLPCIAQYAAQKIFSDVATEKKIASDKYPDKASPAGCSLNGDVRCVC